ncbi:hypothetical protein AAHD62_24260, partial [Enterobacter hormaechei]
MPYNTNNSVPSSDLRDVYDNKQTMDEVVNSSSKEVTTRTGKKVKTLAGLQADVVGIGQSASQSAQAAASSAAAAAQSAADAANSAAATGYVAPPLPDVWAPLNDDLRLLAGFAPADTITVAGTSYPLPSKSITFSRATTATYIDKSGVLRTAAINEPRFEKEGLLMEGAGTNHILYSNDPSKWSPLNVAIASTNNLAPDGTLTAAKVNISSANSTNLNLGASVASYAAFTTGGYITSTFFMKAGERSLVQIIWTGGATGISSKYANFDLINGVVDGTCYAYSIQKLANGWWRCNATALIEGDM